MDGEGTDGGLLFQSLKEKQKGLFLQRLLGYLCGIPSAKREGLSQNKENSTAPGTRQCACA